MKNSIFLLFFVGFFVAFSQQTPKIIYIADPLCSWCYGFQVEMDKVIEKYKVTCKLELLVGGMGIGNQKPLNQEFIESLQDHWDEVKEESGQVFDQNILKTKGLIYNSEPLCRAIVTAKSMDSSKAIHMHKALQKAFYAQNKNVTQKQELNKCAQEIGLDSVEFSKRYDSEELKKKTQEEFDRVERNGVTGFPVLLLTIGQKTILITDGYTKFRKLDKKLKKELNKK
jgi:putative protein-disulfide isomerase